MISVDYDKIHFDSQDPNKVQTFPFFAWQCLTIEITGRTIDLVIKNDQEMNLILKFLVQAINTVDGRRDTAQFYIDAATIYGIERTEKRLNRQVIRNRKTVEIAEDEEWCGDCEWKYLTEQERQTIRDDNTREIHRQAIFKF